MMQSITVRRIWLFGDNVSTDYMSPGYARLQDWNTRKQHVLHIDPQFAAGCQPGDIVIGGRNFGCGSARESAPRNLRDLGVYCVVAESFGGIFYRNCVAIGLRALRCPGITEHVVTGDLVRVDFRHGRIEVAKTGREIDAVAPQPFFFRSVCEGGLLKLLKNHGPAAAWEPAALRDDATVLSQTSAFNRKGL
jgi:3-isopropylmalate/(R)-2-methylmalate dehydratase small subunit